MARTPSPQQAAIYQEVRQGSGNLIIPAVAGAGKTTTLLNACSLMRGSVAFAAYNKAIATEIQNRLTAAGVGKNVQARTFHSFGLSSWKRMAPKVQIDDKKVVNLLEQLKVDESLHAFVPKLVSLAKNHAIGVLTPFEDMNAWWHLVRHYDLDQELPEGSNTDGNDIVEMGISAAKTVLRAGSQMDTEVIDFDDMLYAPLLHNARVWQNDWLLVDEAQDTNPTRRAYAKKMLRPGGRAIFVGDPHQAIYGFTGADSDSMDIIKREFSCKEKPLTVTYRCPKAVVAHAQMWVNHITAADSAPEGSVTAVQDVDFPRLFPTLTKGDAVLCRNTRPLVSLAFTLIRSRVPCHLEGRDIGRGLLALAKRWKTVRVRDLRPKLDEYLHRETEQFLAKGQEQKAAALADKVDTLLVIIDSLTEDATLNELKSTIDSLFGDTPEGQTPDNLTLSTVHKAKGREWGTVYLWGRNRYMPSPFARQEWQMLQEDNLCYVAVTRAKERLVEVVVTA
jgi:DNA helicase-2/ATP-dependent DNA helicase PcrA